MVRLWASIGALLVVSVLALHAVTPASAQQWAVPGAERHFRVEWDQTTTKRGTVVRGYVHNDQGHTAGNIRLVVEGIDGGGAVATTTIGYVVGTVGPSERLFFEVPIKSPTPNYRLRVGSWEPVGRGGV
jgi:hypothetical protein